MKIGVISDTHARLISEVPSAILNALATVDLIVHAGDFTERAVLDGLTAIGQVKAVSGNMDSQELKKALPRTELFAVGKKKIGLVHGSGGPSGIAERIRELFTDADVIIFGHSHVPCNRYIRGALLFNPGQAKNSFGLITIDASIKADIMPRKRKIVIADDEASIRLLVRSILGNNYTVIEAADGQEAVEAAQSQQPALILMDILMPRKDGLQACYEIKANLATKAIPVVMVTAIDLDLDKKLSADLGADGYITKPFTPQELLDAIGRFLGSPE